VPFVTLQEGDYYIDVLNFCVHTEYSTVNLLWGEATMQHLEKYRCSTDKMVITGNWYFDNVIKKYSTASVRKTVRDELGIKHGKKILALLVGFDWAVVIKKEMWEEVCKGLDKEGLVCIFKWHSLLPVSDFKNVELIIKEIMPSAIVLYTYDPYKVLSIADYCVVLGKTTLAIEALAWQRPLFEIRSLSLSGSHYEAEPYYAKSGIAQLISPLGNWENLFNTMQHGIPSEIQQKVDQYVRRSFYKLDGKSLDRALDVISFILEAKESTVKGQGAPVNRHGSGISGQRSTVKGRVSFIIVSGTDGEALLSTLASLAEGVTFDSWEAVLVVTDGSMKELLTGISGDLTVVESEGANLSQLYNRGAEASSGEFLVFMTPGIVYMKGEGLVEAMRDGVAGMPIKNADMTPYCLGIGFDFNFAPFFIKEEVTFKADNKTQNPKRSTTNACRDAVGGGFIGINREAFITVGGFDEGIANHLIEADICLAAKDSGYSISYLSGCLGVIYKAEAADYWQKAKDKDHDNEWKRRIKFFAKWCGKLPKDDDIVKFMGDRLKI